LCVRNDRYGGRRNRFQTIDHLTPMRVGWRERLRAASSSPSRRSHPNTVVEGELKIEGVRVTGTALLCDHLQHRFRAWLPGAEQACSEQLWPDPADARMPLPTANRHSTDMSISVRADSRTTISKHTASCGKASRQSKR